MPMLMRYFSFYIGSFISPSFSSEFSLVPIISKFHDIINANPTITIIIIIGLPNCPKAINCDFPVISKVPSKCLKLTSVFITAKYHSLLIRFSLIVHLVSGKIYDWFSIPIFYLPTGISKIKVKLSIWPKVNRMDSMIMLSPRNPCKQILFRFWFIISVLIMKNHYTISNGNYYFVSKYTHSMCGINISSLIKNFHFIRFIISVCIF